MLTKLKRIPGKFDSFKSSSAFWLTLLVCILGFSYVASLLPGVGYHGDTAKFQFLGKVLGTPHETGYPTYIILNHLFVKLFPLGSLAYKANLLSALFSVFASFFLFRILVLQELDHSLAFIASLTFGFTYTVWSQSVVAEVYTLNILFVAMVLYYFLRWNKYKEDRDFLIGCYIYALSFGNHLTMITFLPGIIYLVWRTDKKVYIDGRKILWVVLFVSLGAMQYSYLYSRFHDSSTVYLETQVPNLESLFWYITGGQFASKMFSISIGDLISERVPMFLRFLLREYLALIPIILLGMFTFRDKTVNLFLFLSLLGSFLYALNYEIIDIFVYLIPAYLILAVYLGKGFDWQKSIFSRRRLVSSPALLLVIPLFFFVINYGKVNQANTTLAAREVEAMLQTVEDDAVIIPRDYHEAQYFWYYLLGEGLQANNIYQMFFFDLQFPIDTIKAYIYEDKPFYLPFQRAYAPAGLSLYCISPKYVPTLEQNGLAIKNVKGNLYKIERLPGETSGT